MSTTSHSSLVFTGEDAEHKLQELVKLFWAANHVREQREDALRLHQRSSEEQAAARFSKSKAHLAQRWVDIQSGLEKTRVKVNKSLDAFADLSGKLVAFKDPARQLMLDKNPMSAMAEQMHQSLDYFAKAEGHSHEACRHAETAFRVYEKARKALDCYYRTRSDAENRLGEARHHLSKVHDASHKQYLQKELNSLESRLRSLEGEARSDTTRGYEKVSRGCEQLTQLFEEYLVLAERRRHLASGPTAFRLASAAVLGAIVAGLVRYSLILAGFSSWLTSGWKGEGFVSWRENWTWHSWFEWPGLDWTVYQPDTEPSALTVAFVLLVAATWGIYAFREK